jgi:N-acetylglutamate synthase-like GNAT family acetyltransferase
MIIRDATSEDFPDLDRIGRAFAEAAGLPEVDKESLECTLQNLIDNGILKVAEQDMRVVGCIGVLVFPLYSNLSYILAQELFWWIDREYRGTSGGIRLLNVAEAEAKKLGAKRMMMLCLDRVEGDKVASLYQKLGYESQERTFTKWL